MIDVFLTIFLIVCSVLQGVSIFSMCRTYNMQRECGPTWCPVSVGLPKYAGKYVVAIKDRSVSEVLFYSKNDNRWLSVWGEDCKISEKITHWANMPVPPNHKK